MTAPVLTSLTEDEERAGARTDEHRSDVEDEHDQHVHGRSIRSGSSHLLEALLGVSSQRTLTR